MFHILMPATIVVQEVEKLQKTQCICFTHLMENDLQSTSDDEREINLNIQNFQQRHL